MVEESSPLLPPAEESIEAETDTALEPQSESGEPTPEPAGEPGFVCDCEERMRSACDGLPFYKEHESRRYCVLHYPGKDKSADFKAALDSKLNNKDFDFRGVWFPDDANFSGLEFNADVDFSFATFSADASFSDTTFSDRTFTDFSSATFSSRADFSFAKFNGLTYFSSATFNADANFLVAQFNGLTSFKSTTFRAIAGFTSVDFKKGADFSSAKFDMGAQFESANFSANGRFDSVTFKARAIFMFATFSADQDFSLTEFNSAASFIGATFKGRADFNLRIINLYVDFRRAFFADAVRFFGFGSFEKRLPGGSASLNFEHARFERANLVSFHTAALRPHWFVNVDSRNFVFTDVDWGWDFTNIETEIASLAQKHVPLPRRLLAISCHQLAENAATNSRYEEASRFRYWAMELARTSKWKGWTFWKTDWLHMLYWAVSGYGERILRALGVLAGVWFLFVLLYTRVGFVQQSTQAPNEGVSSPTAASMTIEDKIGQPLGFSRALTYSLAVMSLQKPEPKPLTDTAQTLVLLETILGPVQAALLALAIRRKFMR